MPTWKEEIRDLVRQHCNRSGLRTFTLQDFLQSNLDRIAKNHPDNNHPKEKIRQTLQFLRNEKFLDFEDYYGSYTLRDANPLEGELDDSLDVQSLLISLERQPEKREYYHEIFARNRGWVRQAKREFGNSCMLIGCGLNFQKEDGSNYVEVHHIKPLCEGGTDGLWNLSVVCAHHHRMAHFAQQRERHQIRSFLEQANAEKLGA